MSGPPRDRVAIALAELDRRIADHDLAIWIGAEPTFTRRESAEPWWLWQADAPGADKRDRADAVAAALARRIPGATVAERPGRTYPGEAAPRFCVGVAWGDGVDAALTITPDPGVVEVNAAPCPDLVRFLGHARDVYAAAAEAGLAPLRYRYNGDVIDSGGGGQLTLGGPTPEASPWLRHPATLPRLVRYLALHPALSYWFTGEHAGSASQAPRADEGVRERWDELGLACAWLERAAARGAVTPELLGATLGPLLVDAAGNAHRAEVNVEKLWSPRGDRGRLGLVELRAFKMPPTPEQLAAAAALVRAIAARCALAPVDEPMPEWGADLHDKMALPVLLAEDLRAVYADLDAHGLGLGPELEGLAASYRDGRLWRDEPFPGITVAVSRAVEFWPLVGDVASQEGATSRLVDASSERLELAIEVERGRVVPDVVIAGRDLVMIAARRGGDRDLWITGLRRRVYVPQPGLLPGVGAQDPLELRLRHHGEEVRVRVHGWRPGGGPYDGLPADAAEAARRRAERLVVERLAPAPPRAPGIGGLLVPDRFTVDLRALEDAP